MPDTPPAPGWADICTDLMRTLAQRRSADARDSYTARLLQGEEDALLKKLVEEAGEAALAAKGGDGERLREELADLWFHCFAVMTRYNIPLESVAAVLARRRGTSGVQEKLSRAGSSSTED